MNTYVKTKKIFTKRMATYLRKKGFQIVKVMVNSNKPQHDIYVFEDTFELQEAIAEFMSVLLEERQNEKKSVHSKVTCGQ